MRKPKLYFLLAKQAKLEPVSGDRINEMGLVRALSQSFDVYYNGVLAYPHAEVFGRDDGQIETPAAGAYDLVYVRANRDVFLAAPHPKIWFASPYDKECFDAADAIACMTRPWKERLADYSAADFAYFDEMYPQDMPAPRKCLLVPQVVKRLPNDAELSELRARDVLVARPAPKGWNAKLAAFLERFQSPDTRPVIRHFGPIRASNYPHQLVQAMQSDAALRKQLSAQSVGAGDKMDVPAVIEALPRMPQDDALALLAQSNAIWYNQHRSGNFAGSLKVLEAMAMGVPILAPNWDARRDELGEDYPLFWTPRSAAHFEEVDQPSFRKTLETLLSLSDAERASLSDELRARVERFTVSAVSEFLCDEFAEYL